VGNSVATTTIVVAVPTLNVPVVVVFSDVIKGLCTPKVNVVVFSALVIVSVTI
jgi:hypothetical protein